jgi:thioredoxin 1
MSKFNDLINSEKPVLVDFSAEWCGPCKEMAPILKQLASKISEKAKIIKVDIDRNPDAARQYKVEAVPTLMIFKNGQIKWRQTGLIPQDQLLSTINSFI